MCIYDIYNIYMYIIYYLLYIIYVYVCVGSEHSLGDIEVHINPDSVIFVNLYSVICTFLVICINLYCK